MRFRAAHLVVAGFLAQAAYIAWTWTDATATEREVTASGTTALLVDSGITLLGLVPAVLLWRKWTHQAGRWSALLLGWVAVLSVFWAIQGLFLVAAFVVATWWERGKPVPPPAPIA